ncbi:Aldo/keto reductase family-domain-containing protein [Dipodascopsis uninucleata]
MVVAKNITNILPGVAIGGGVFNTQMNEDPGQLPIARIIKRAFDVGIRAIDTSPYYGKSEILIGQALRSPEVKNNYKREDYVLMTKAGRVSLDSFDYSQEGIRNSVTRSLQRLNTIYLDIVFCHDVEFNRPEDALTAVSTLFKLQEEGIIGYVGISGYPPSVLVKVIQTIIAEFGRPPDVVQNYGCFNLQNTTLLSYLDEINALGVGCIINSSPLCMGLLSGHAAAAFHPASEGLRNACLKLSEWAKLTNYTLPELAMRFAIGKWAELSFKNGGGVIISGVSYLHELEMTIEAYKDVMCVLPKSAEGQRFIYPQASVDKSKLAVLEPYFQQAREVLGDWADKYWDMGNIKWEL